MAAISPSTPPQTRSPHEYVSLWICRKNQSKEKKSWQQQRRPPPFPAVHTRQCDAKGCASLKLALQKAARSLILLKDGGGPVEVRIFGPDKG